MSKPTAYETEPSSSTHVDDIVRERHLEDGCVKRITGIICRDRHDEAECERFGSIR